MTGKRLSEDEQQRIEALTIEGLSPNKIALEIGRSHHTIAKHIHDPEAGERIANKLEVMVERIADSVSAEDILKANLVAKLTSIGIAIDKIRLHRGQHTQMDVHVLLDAVQAIKAQREP